MDMILPKALALMRYWARVSEDFGAIGPYCIVLGNIALYLRLSVSGDSMPRIPRGNDRETVQ